MVPRGRPLPWQQPHLHLRIAAWAAIAMGWLLLGLNSANVPWGTPAVWTVVCGLVAGTAIGFLTRRTKASLNVYLLAATFVGLVRSLAYLSNDAGGPAAVWFIVAMTNLLLYIGHDEWEVPRART